MLWLQNVQADGVWTSLIKWFSDFTRTQPKISFVFFFSPCFPPLFLAEIPKLESHLSLLFQGIFHHIFDFWVNFPWFYHIFSWFYHIFPLQKTRRTPLAGWWLEFLEPAALAVRSESTAAGEGYPNQGHWQRWGFVHGLVNVPFWGCVSHHLQICVGDYIPNSWVMFNWDIYQPLFNCSDCSVKMTG